MSEKFNFSKTEKQKGLENLPRKEQNEKDFFKNRKKFGKLF